jgi:hypothetical protein
MEEVPIATSVDIIGYSVPDPAYLNRTNNYTLTFDANALAGSTRIAEEHFAFSWFFTPGYSGLELSTDFTCCEPQTANERFFATVTGNTTSGNGTLNARGTYPSTAQDAVYIKVSAPVSVVASPASVTVVPGTTSQLSSSTKDYWNTDISSSYANLRTWTSSNPQIATVSPSGLVTGVACGSSSVTVRAADSKFGATSNAVAVTVSPCVARVEVSPGTAQVPWGNWQQYTFRALDANGNTIPAQTAAWRVADQSIATVDGSGLVHGGTVNGQRTTVYARVGNVEGSAEVVVADHLISIWTGTGTMSPGQTCGWLADPDDGVWPYTYEWLVVGVVRGSGQHFNYTAGSSSFQLTLRTTDSFGQVVNDTHTVDVVAGAPSCITY